MVIIPSQMLNVGEFSRTVSSSRLTDSLEQAFCLLWSSIVWTFFLGGGGGEDVNDRDNPDKFAQKRLPCRVIPPILWTLSLIWVLAAVTVVTSQVPCYLFEWCNLPILSFLLYRYWVTHVWFSLQLRGHSCYWSALSFKATCFEGTRSCLVTLSIHFILLIYQSRLMSVLKSYKKAGFTTSCLRKYKKTKPSDYGKDKQIR